MGILAAALEVIGAGPRRGLGRRLAHLMVFFVVGELFPAKLSDGVDWLLRQPPVTNGLGSLADTQTTGSTLGTLLSHFANILRCIETAYDLSVCPVRLRP